MSELPAEDQTVVFVDAEDEDGSSMWRAVHLSAQGAMVIEAHDQGPALLAALGAEEYEYERRLDVAETARARELLGLTAGDDLLAALQERFASTRDLEEFLVEADVPGSVWSRIGDA